jgi:hypothetical protein
MYTSNVVEHVRNAFCTAQSYTLKFHELINVCGEEKYISLIYGLFKNAVRISQYTVLRERMISK